MKAKNITVFAFAVMLMMAVATCTNKPANTNTSKPTNTSEVKPIPSPVATATPEATYVPELEDAMRHVKEVDDFLSTLR